MVALLTNAEKNRLNDAITQAEQKTSAEIIVALARSSDNYMDYFLLYSFLFADFILLAPHMLHWSHDIALMLLAQLAIMSTICIPSVRGMLCCLIPEKVKARRSFKTALFEFHAVERKMPAGTAFALLYISIHERYAHVVCNRTVQQEISDAKWHELIQAFKHTVRLSGLGAACSASADAMADILAVPFPQTSTRNQFSDQPVEVRGNHF